MAFIGFCYRLFIRLTFGLYCALCKGSITRPVVASLVAFIKHSTRGSVTGVLWVYSGLFVAPIMASGFCNALYGRLSGGVQYGLDGGLYGGLYGALYCGALSYGLYGGLFYALRLLF